jgi:hypothetical protein
MNLHDFKKLSDEKQLDYLQSLRQELQNPTEVPYSTAKGLGIISDISTPTARTLGNLSDKNIREILIPIVWGDEFIGEKYSLRVKCETAAIMAETGDIHFMDEMLGLLRARA